MDRRVVGRASVSLRGNQSVSASDHSLCLFETSLGLSQGKRPRLGLEAEGKGLVITGIFRLLEAPLPWCSWFETDMGN